jgi:diguanylate cyclase (GGDEF)-like protein
MAKLLVIDDDSHFRGIIERIILRNYNYSVTTVASEEEAWEELSRSSYDLVLLDLFIDGRKSWDTLRRIRVLPSPPVVIVISCEDLPTNAEYARRLGAADFVPKPIDFVRFKAAMDAALGAVGTEERGAAIGLLVVAGRENRGDLVSSLSCPRFRLFVTEDPGRASETIRKERLDAVLVRVDEDAGPTADFLASLSRAEPERLRLPVIAITDAVPDRILAVLRAGADDYVPLPLDARILAAKVDAQIRIRSEYRNTMLRTTATGGKHSVSGLYSRSSIRDRLGVECLRSRRHKRDLAVGLLRLNHLEGMRADLGPLVSDTVIAETSRILRAAFRNSDILGHYGANEFAIILPESAAEQIAPRADWVRGSVEAGITAVLGQRNRVVCRMGLASVPPIPHEEPGADADQLPDDILEMVSVALSRGCAPEGSRVKILGGR